MNTAGYGWVGAATRASGRGRVVTRRAAGLAGDVLTPQQLAELWAMVPALLVPEAGR